MAENENGISDSIKRRLLKVLALAERGEGGEKEAAEAMLANLLKKHGITMDDLKGSADVKEWIELSFSGELERLLLIQIVGKVSGDSSVSIQKQRRTRTKLWFNLTKQEHIEVELMFSILKRAFENEVDTLFSAFIQKNRIFPKADPRGVEDDEPMTPERLAQIKRIAAMMQMMNPVPIYQAIEGK